MQRRRDVIALLGMQMLAVMDDPRPRPTPEFGAPAPSPGPQPYRVGDEPETVIEDILERRQRIRELIERGRRHLVPIRVPPGAPWGALGSARSPGPQGLSDTRTLPRPRRTRGGGVRTRHRLGAASFQSMLVVLELSALGNAFWMARSPQERVAIAGSCALELGLEYLALRYLPIASAPLGVLFLQGDSPDLAQREAEMRWRRQWPYHVHCVAQELANDLQAFDRLLIDTEHLLEHLGAMVDRSYLVRRLTELSEGFMDLYDSLIESITQLSVQDFPAVRAKLVAMGVDGELVQDMI